MKKDYCIPRILVVLLLLFPSLLNAQLNTLSGTDSLNIFHYRVKQFNEFADRFNGFVDYNGKEIPEKSRDSLKRKSILISLLNMQDPRLEDENPLYSGKYVQLNREFITDILRNGYFLDKSSENIYARTYCTGTIKNEDCRFSIILHQEKVGKDMLKWSVDSIEADFLDVFREDSVYLRFLPPSSDELDFMELRRAFRDRDHLPQYASRSFTYHPLSVFLYLVNTGDLKIEAVERTEYIIRDIPGWEITVREFDHQSNNSGWLIHNIEKVMPAR